MAYEIIRPNFQLPVPAASTIVPRSVVKLAGTSSLQILPVGTNTDQPFGILGEATAYQGLQPNDAVLGMAADVREPHNIVKAIAAASFAAGVELMVASIGVATIAQGGSYTATVAQMGPLVAASGAGIWTVGWALDSPNAGEVFTLYFNARKTGGQA